MEIAELIKPETLCPDSQAQEGYIPPSPLPDNGLVYERDYIGIESRLLNDTFILCLDKNKHKLVMREHPGIPIYLLEEMEELLPYTDDGEFIRQVHACKKKFGGWVVPKDKQTFRFVNQEIRHE